MEKLSYSRMQTVKDCPRKYRLRYRDGIERISEAEPLWIGKLIHAGLALWHEGKSQDEIILHIRGEIEHYEPPLSSEEHFKWELNREVICRLLLGYFWRWSDWHKQCITIAAEQEFHIPITNPESGRISRTFDLCGVIDRIVKLPDGRTAIEEIKTASSAVSLLADSDYWKHLRIDTQISLYWWGASQLGHKIDTILYSVIRKPGISPKILTQAQTKHLIDTGEYAEAEGQLIGVFDVQVNGEAILIDDVPVTEIAVGKSIDKSTGKPNVAIRETLDMFGARLTFDIYDRPDIYYAIQEIPRLQYEIDDCQYGLWQIAGMIRDCSRHGRWFRNDRECLRYGQCEYWPLCSNGFDPDKDPLPEGYTQTKGEANGNSTTETDTKLASDNR